MQQAKHLILGFGKVGMNLILYEKKAVAGRWGIEVGLKYGKTYGLKASFGER